MPYAVFVHVNLDPATNVNVPTRTSRAIRGTVHAPFSRDFAGRPFGPSNCLPTVTTFADDVDAFLNGFVAISNAGTS